MYYKIANIRISYKSKSLLIVLMKYNFVRQKGMKLSGTAVKIVNNLLSPAAPQRNRLTSIIAAAGLHIVAIQ